MPTNPYPAEVRLLLLLCRRPAGSEGNQQVSEQAVAFSEQVTDWDRFLYLAAFHRVMPLVCRSVVALALAPPIFPSRVAAKLQAASGANAVEAFRSLAETSRLLSLLASVGIEATVLKGIPLSIQAFDDVSARDVGDIDLLIQSDQSEVADRLLQANGLLRRDPAAKLTPRRRSFYVRSFKDYTYEPINMQSAGGFEVDLHWRLFRTSYMPGNQLTDARRTCISVGPLQLRTLTPSDQLLYLAIQGALDGWSRLRSVADFAALWHAVSNHDELLEQARKLKTMPYLHAALSLADRWIGGMHLAQESGLDHLPSRDLSLAGWIVTRAERRMQTAHFMPRLRDAASWSMKRYEASLHPSLAYKCAIFKRILFRPRIWDRFDLPDVLFPLYPFLSPLEWLLFRQQTKQHSSGKPRHSA